MMPPLTKTALTRHEIKLEPDARPVYIPAYRLPHARRQIVEDIVTDMAKKGIVRPSKSPWNAPLILVPKKNGTLRPVVDYRKLNDKTIPDRFPIPVLSDILRDLGTGNIVFSSIDLTQGFWQIELEEGSKPFTAFSTPQGHWEFNRMPFGLRNSPLTFSRIMNHVFHGLIGKTLHLYLDDLIIVSKTMEEHLQKLEVVFSRLQKANLLINVEKCDFLRKELRFLGHTVDHRGRQANQDKVTAVTDFPKPTNAQGIRSFLGLVGFYRCFIEGFSIIAAPLTALLKKDVVFVWTPDQETAFITLKQKLTTAPILIYPDYNDVFVLATDASKYGIGAALMQQRDGKLRPVGFFSSKTNQAEQNYGITDLEALGVIKSLVHFKEIILGYRIEVHTDHSALSSYFTSGKNAHGRVGRWMITFSEFDPIIKYIPGKTNVVADALSRYVATTTLTSWRRAYFKVIV